MYDQYVEAEHYAAPMILKYITGAESLDTFDSFAQKAPGYGLCRPRDDMQPPYDAMPKE
jgi:hypothetical protein